MTVSIQTADFDLGTEVAALREADPGVGAVASFVGCVRDRRDPKVGAALGRTALEVAIRITEQIRPGLARR